jgi:hypothetical protein
MLLCSHPGLDGPGVVPGVRQRITAAMPEHVAMDLETEASAFPNAFNQPINGIQSERAVSIRRKHVL